jgi:hypothetical protein
MLRFLRLCTSIRALAHHSLNLYFGFKHHLTIRYHLLPLILVGLA